MSPETRKPANPQTREPRKVSPDCLYFLGDRPCVWHKFEGAICECERYRRVEGDLLIIKLDAVGDVLRTTCLLPVIAKAWPNLRVSWITRVESTPLLRENPYVTEILAYGPDALVQLGSRNYRRVINLDAGKTSAGLAAIAQASEKIGFVLDPAGHVTATNAAAEEWLRLGVFDDLKRANTRTYQDVMCSILGLPAEDMRYVLELVPSETEAAGRRLAGMGVDLSRPVLGVHTGGGGRWKLKQWNRDSFVALIPRLLHEWNDLQILLFGGPLEKELNEQIVAEVGGSVFDTGCHNSLREFAALVDRCAVMVSGDSLAMHVALARGARAVVLFGPTSHHEIELFGLGEKVVPDLDCLVCYKMDCDFVPNCMDSISVEQVAAAVGRQLKVVEPGVSHQAAKPQR